MFYVKQKLSEEAEINIDITDENVYTRCPICGCEHCVDISELFAECNVDLYGTSVYCEECARKSK